MKNVESDEVLRFLIPAGFEQRKKLSMLADEGYQRFLIQSLLYPEKLDAGIEMSVKL